MLFLSNLDMTLFKLPVGFVVSERISPQKRFVKRGVLNYFKYNTILFVVIHNLVYVTTMLLFVLTYYLVFIIIYKYNCNERCCLDSIEKPKRINAVLSGGCYYCSHSKASSNVLVLLFGSLILLPENQTVFDDAFVSHSPTHVW